MKRLILLLLLLPLVCNAASKKFARPVPIATLTASAVEIVAGQATMLSWTTTNATSASLSAVGSVALNGTLSVSPLTSTTYVLTAYGRAGMTATAQVTVTVTQPTPPPPQLASPQITALPLSFATEGMPYNSCAAATGGVPPYTWGLDAGTLPPGLTLHALDGCLDGTPIAAGSFTYTLRVTDSR